MVIFTPDQRLRVYVSSVLDELAAERLVVRDVIAGLRLRPVLLEMGHHSHPPRALYRPYIEQSHVFIGLYGLRYGPVDPETGVAAIEEQLRLAAALPRLLYIAHSDADREAGLEGMLGQIREAADVSYRSFSSLDELADVVADDLAVLLSERFSTGGGGPLRGVASTNEGSGERLPVSPTSFVGREVEQERITQLLLRDDVRLVTLAGGGGIGKTRLAVEVGRALRSQFPDGVHLVALAGVEDPALVLPTIANTLDIRTDERGPTESWLAAALSGRRMLIILDNFEQVIDAAPRIARLLEAAPQLHVLATSRRPLRITAEHQYQVPTLGVPDDDPAARPEEIAEADAVRLFVDRASAVRPGFRLTESDAQAVAAICRRLDGVPLAIELAAARVRLLAPQALLERLDSAIDVLAGGLADLPERQRSLRATLDWSHSLLEEDAQRCLAELSTFGGSWTLSAAEAVCSGDPDVLDRLAELVDNSMVLVEVDQDTPEPRFRMLQPVREYARQRLLERGGAEEVDARHLQFYSALATQAGGELGGREQAQWLRRLEDETANFAVAAKRALAAGARGLLVDVAWHLWIWLWLNNHINEARHWLDPILEREHELTDHQRARLHWSVGGLRFEQGDYDSSESLLRRSLEEFTDVQDSWGRGLALMMVGALAPRKGEADAGQQHLLAALDLLRGQGDRFCAALTAASLGVHVLVTGDVEQADRHFQEALAEAQAIDNHPMLAQTWLGQSFAAMVRGDLARAQQLLTDVVASAGTPLSDEILAYGLDGLAGVAVASGDGARAATLLGAAAGLRQRTGLFPWPHMRQVIDAWFAAAKDLVGPESFGIAWDSGHGLTRAAARAFAVPEADASPAAPEPTSGHLSVG